MCWLGKFFGGTIERPSPSDWLLEDAIRAWAETLPWERLFVQLSKKPKIWVPMIPNTNSMDGTFDFGHNNILIAGASESDHKKLVDYLAVGDIAVYQTTGNPIIHRIVKIGNDANGKYFKFKGDNNYASDAGMVRGSEIEWVSVGVIY